MKRTEQEQAEQTIDAITLRVFTAVFAGALVGAWSKEKPVQEMHALTAEHAARLLQAVKAKERELDIGIRIYG